MKIVSLLASATEIVCALGLRDSLVGRSHECDYPADVLGLPRCTDPSFAIEGSSQDIDRAVKQAARQALSIYRVDEHKLAELRPDVIITQTQCEVCAVSLKDVEAALARSLHRDCRVIALSPYELSDVYDDVMRIAVALGVRSNGADLVIQLKRQFVKISAMVGSLPRPTIAVLEWLDPLMAAGHWIPELVEIAGGVNVFGQAGQKAPWLSWEQLRAADPDVILAAPCGFGIRRTRGEMPALTGNPEWQKLQAVANNRFHVSDGNQFFSRPGPRLVESAKILAEVLHPGQIDFGLGEFHPAV